MSDRPSFRGDFATWQEAAAGCASYQAPAILERVRAAARRVRSGEAAYERDGVTFAEPRAHHPLLAALYRAAREGAGGLRVVDVGGSLGSLYWQHRRWLAALEPLSWRVVEQPHFVAAGRSEFGTAALSFHEDLASACAGGPADVIVLSGVLQCVPEPHRLLAGVVAAGARWVWIDRLPLLPGAEDRLAIETVPAELGEASYPCWFLSESRLLAAIDSAYSCEDAFFTVLEGGRREEWSVFGASLPARGFLFRHRP